MIVSVETDAGRDWVGLHVQQTVGPVVRVMASFDVSAWVVPWLVTYSFSGEQGKGAFFAWRVTEIRARGMCEQVVCRFLEGSGHAPAIVQKGTVDFTNMEAVLKRFPLNNEPAKLKTWMDMDARAAMWSATGKWLVEPRALEFARSGNWKRLATEVARVRPDALSELAPEDEVDVLAYYVIMDYVAGRGGKIKIPFDEAEQLWGDYKPHPGIMDTYSFAGNKMEVRWMMDANRRAVERFGQGKEGVTLKEHVEGARKTFVDARSIHEVSKALPGSTVFPVIGRTTLVQADRFSSAGPVPDPTSAEHVVYVADRGLAHDAALERREMPLAMCPGLSWFKFKGKEFPVTPDKGVDPIVRVTERAILVSDPGPWKRKELVQRMSSKLAKDKVVLVLCLRKGEVAKFAAGAGRREGVHALVRKGGVYARFAPTNMPLQGQVVRALAIEKVVEVPDGACDVVFVLGKVAERFEREARRAGKLVVFV